MLHKSRHRDDSLSSDQVISLYEDNNKNLWIGTKYGLNRLNPDGRTFSHYYTSEYGLPNNTIYGILGDNEGNLWISTNRGLSKFNPERNIARNYFVSDGLQNNEFNGNVCYKSRQGKLYFGGVRGFNAFFPDQIKEKIIPSNL